MYPTAILIPDPRGSLPSTVSAPCWWYCGQFFAYTTYFHINLPENKLQQCAETDAGQLLPRDVDPADFVSGWLAGYQACVQRRTYIRVYHQQRCLCEHLLRAPVEKERGYCLECGIVAALVPQEASYARY